MTIDNGTAPKRELALLWHVRLRPDSSELLGAWYIDMIAENLSPRTIQGYADDLRRFAQSFPRALNEATPADLDAYFRECTLRGVSPKSRARYVSAIRKFYSWLRRREGKAVSIAEDLRQPRKTETVHRWLTAEQVQQLRSSFPPTIVGIRDRAIAELGLMALRVSEVTGLNVEHVLEIQDPNKAAVIVWRKGGREQVLPLPEDTRLALDKWMLARVHIEERSLFFRIPYHESHPRMNRGSVSRLFLEWAKRAGVPVPPKRAYHLLRHSAGQRMADLGMGIEEAQAFLGHKDPRTTMTYYQVSDVRLRKMAGKLRYE